MKYFKVMIIAITVVAIAGGWLYVQNKHNNQSTEPRTELEVLVQKLDPVIDLPTDRPTLADVTDISKLQNQHFFDHAQNGDKVLIYLEAGRAILYRPSTGKVIEVGPVQLVDGCLTDPKALGCKNKK